jgi:hypothetical protein
MEDRLSFCISNMPQTWPSDHVCSVHEFSKSVSVVEVQG